MDKFKSKNIELKTAAGSQWKDRRDSGSGNLLLAVMSKETVLRPMRGKEMSPSE